MRRATSPGGLDPLTRTVVWIAERPWVGGALLLVLLSAAVAGLLGEAPKDRLQKGDAWTVARAMQDDFQLDMEGGFLAIFGELEEGAAAGLLRSLEAAVESTPWVDELVTPWDLPGQGEASLREIRALPLVGELPLGAGGWLFPVAFGQAQGFDEHGEAQVLEAAREALEKGGASPLPEVGLTGQRAIVRAQAAAFESERWRFMGFGALLGFLIASGAFRNVRATFLAGLPPILGVVLSVGLARLVGLGSDGFTTIVLPLLVLTIGFADSLHIVVAAVRARGEAGHGGNEGFAPMGAAIRELTWPCFLTSLTTAIGFASLATAGHTLVAEFGLSCALATAITFVTVVLFIPLLARTPLGARLDRVRPPRFDEHTADSGGPVTGLVRRLVAVPLGAPRVTALTGLGLTLVSVLIASGLEADRVVMSDLADSSQAARTLARVDRDFGGVFPLHVRMDWDPGARGEDLLEVSQRVERVLDSEAQIQGILGPSALIGSMGQGAAWPALALLPERWRTPFVQLDARRALVHARVPDAGSQTLIPVYERVRRRLDGIQQQYAGVSLGLVGDHIAYLETVDDVTRDLAWSLALAAGLILVTLALAFRSLRLGLASVVPNLLPLGVSAAGLALMGGHVDISTLTALTLSLGIATDDTIHVLARWVRTSRCEPDPPRAAEDAILRTLPALTMTTLTLTAAFGQLLTSALPTIRDFGLVAGITLVAAFLADALLLPSILVVLAGKGVKRG